MLGEDEHGGLDNKLLLFTVAKQVKANVFDSVITTFPF